MLPPNDEAFLLSLKGKVGAEFAQKGLKAVEQGGFAAGLQIFRSFSQPGELKNKGSRIRSLKVSFESCFRARSITVFFVRGKARALVEEAAELELELADGPVAFEAFISKNARFHGASMRMSSCS